MVNEYTKSNTGKLLAAVIAMLMVVCAVAVVAMPAEADDAASAPTFSGTETLTVDEAVTSANIARELSSTYYNETTKTLTVPAEGLTITLAADMGTEKEPLDLNIVLNGDLKFTSENNSKIYITTSTLNGTSASAGSGDFTIEFDADNSVIQFDGVTAVLNNTVYSLISNMYPSVTGAMYVTGGANVTLKQDYSGSTWLNADGSDGDETYLVVTGSSAERSVINFDGTRSIQGFVLDADYADINVKNSNTTGIVLKAGSTLDNSKISVNGAAQAGILVKGKVTMTASTIETTGTGSDNSAYPGIEFSIWGNKGLGTGADAPGIEMTDDASAVKTDSFGYGVEWAADPSSVTPAAGSEKITITGGNVTGNFQGIRTTAANVSTLEPTYNLDGVTLTGTSTNEEGVTLASAGEGFTVADNLRNKGTLKADAPVTVNGKLTNTGSVGGTNAITGTGSVISENGANIDVPVQTPSYENGNAEEVFVYGNSYRTFWYPNEQIVTVPEGQTWTIVANGTIVIPYMLNVLGDLVLEEDATLIIGAYTGMSAGTLTGDTGYGKADIANSLTIEEGASLIIATGEVTVNGETAVDGTVEVGQGTNAAKLNINNDMAMSEYSTLKQGDAGEITVAADVTLTIEGTLGTAAEISNSGAIVINSTPIDPITSEIAATTNSITVNMAADGASVVVENFAVKDGASLYVNDGGLKVTDTKTIADYNKTSNIRFSSAYSGSAFHPSVISGLTVVEDFSYDRAKDKVTSCMEISGNIAADAIGDSEDFAAYLYLEMGSFSVPDTDAANDLAIGENVTLNNNADLTVNGYVPVNKKATIVNSSEITLAGAGHIYMIETASNEITDVINAAHYITTVDTEDFRNYVTVDAAIAAANADSTIDEIVLYGENTLTASATLPAIDFTFDATGTILNIGDKDDENARDVRLDVSAGANYGKVGTTNVYGTLYFNDRTDLKASEDTIKADVVSKQVDAEGKEVKNGWAKYTNVYTAMNEASAGDVINVFEDATVTLDRDFTVKDGVTLVIPDGAKIVINDGVTLTVAGTLQSESTTQGIVAESMFAKKAVKSEVEPETNASAIVVTGTLKVVEDIVYETDNPTTTLASGSFVSGAYYSDGDYNYVTPLATAVSATVLPTIIEGIDVYGAVTEGDTTFAATDDCDTITVYGQLTLSSLTLSNEAVLATSGTGWYSGTVTVGDASVQAVKVTGLKIDSDEGLIIDNATVKYIADGKDDTPENNEAVFTATAGTVVIDGTVIGNMTVAAGATVTVPSAESSDKTGTVDGALTVDGTVTVGNGQTLNVDDLYVNGTVTVAAQTDAATAGTLDVVNEKMFVGLDAEFETTGTAASVNGYVDVDTIYAVAGSTLSDATVTDEMESTEYYVEDALWITVYTNADNVYIYDADMDKAVPVENAYFAKTWTDSDGKKYSSTDNTAAIVGSVSAVYAQVNYDVYVINLRADQNAVSSISIDGSLMQFGMIFVDGGMYYGYTAIVAAGAHTIQYQLANGYSGNGVLTVNGTQQSGLTFTTEGTPTADDEVNGVEGMLQYNLQLTGFEKSGYVPDSPDTGSDSGDSGMTITDYLLIVLVVLIIVMAIIVAMRLMRS